MTRKLTAAFACRAGGSRLYGKPLQNLEPGTTILDQVIASAKAAPDIAEIVLGIAEGNENLVFADVARKHGVGYILGSEKDVLFRLIQCGRAAAATDVFRLTTECPFAAWELLPAMWKSHVDKGNDITVVDFLPEGMHFEIYSLAALEKSHANGLDRERSEFCSAYARRCPEQFRIEIVTPPESWRRLDLRVTVDQPEDLILAREIYRALKDKAPHIPVGDVVAFLDAHPELTELVKPYVVPEPLWAPKP